MLLDAVLASPDLTWLATDSEKTDWLGTLPPSGRTDTPSAASGDHASDNVTGLPGTFPIGLDLSGRPVLLYPATVPWTQDFRTFLQGHATLLRRASTWTLRLVFPRPVDLAYDGYQTVIRDELETPLQPATIRDLKSYFEWRRAAAHQRPDTVTRASLDGEPQAFSAPRFTLLYRRWLKHGDAVLESLSSPGIAEALAGGTGHVESIVLPHSYRHLSPLVDGAPASLQRVEEGFRRGEERGEEPPARSEPPS